MQYLFTIFLGILYGISATLIFEWILKTNKKLRNKYYKKHNIFFGYHAHHSCYGIVSIIFGVLLRQNTEVCLFLISFGIGIIIQHTLSARRFVFIEKH